MGIKVLEEVRHPSVQVGWDHSRNQNNPAENSQAQTLMSQPLSHNVLWGGLTSYEIIDCNCMVLFDHLINIKKYRYY